MNRTNVTGTLWAVAAVVLVCTDTSVTRGQAQPGVPGRLGDYIRTHVKLTSAAQARLLQGQPVTQLLDDADPSREVSVFGAVWVKAPIARYVAAVRDIEQMEKGDAFLVTKRLSRPPRLEDFDQLTLPEEDFSDLKTCRLGSCEVKISEGGLARLHKEIDWSKPTAKADVDRLVRTLAVEYVNGYLEGGNDQLAAYRDSERPTFIAKEFASMIDRMPSLTEYLPDLKEYLLGFPKTTLPMSESFLYWQNVRFGLKPTIRINHLTIVEQQANVAVVSKMLFASHYFWTAIELRVLVPDPARGQGFWFANVNRSRSDGLSGFIGRLIRGKVRGEAEKGMQAALEATKASLERP